MIGMNTFGASAPLKDLQRKFGFEPDQIVAVAKELLRKNREPSTDVSAPTSTRATTEVHPEMAQA
jgi:pyruvate dehydrogenase complex dehydrogenase (E1) component